MAPKSLRLPGESLPMYKAISITYVDTDNILNIPPEVLDKWVYVFYADTLIDNTNYTSKIIEHILLPIGLLTATDVYALFIAGDTSTCKLYGYQVYDTTPICYQFQLEISYDLFTLLNTTLTNPKFITFPEYKMKVPGV